MNKYISLLFALIFIFSCKTSKVNSLVPIQKSILLNKKADLTVEELKTWHHKDIIEDTIPGISLDKAYKELIKDK